MQCLERRLHKANTWLIQYVVHCTRAGRLSELITSKKFKPPTSFCLVKSTMSGTSIKVSIPHPLDRSISLVGVLEQPEPGEPTQNRELALVCYCTFLSFVPTISSTYGRFCMVR